jgi:hypothetical protein
MCEIHRRADEQRNVGEERNLLIASAADEKRRREATADRH